MTVSLPVSLKKEIFVSNPAVNIRKMSPKLERKNVASSG